MERFYRPLQGATVNIGLLGRVGGVRAADAPILGTPGHGDAHAIERAGQLDDALLQGVGVRDEEAN